MAFGRSILFGVVSAMALAGMSAAVLANGPEPGGGGGGYSPEDAATRYNPTKDYQAGIAALQASKFDAADQAFTRIIRQVPRDANVRFYLGVAKAGKNDLKGARDQYDQALRVDRNHIMARREYAITLFKLGEKDKATAELATLKQRAATCADACKEAADLKAAVAAVESAVAAPSPQTLLTDPSLLFTSAATGEHAYFDAVGKINEQRYDEALTSLHQAEVAFGPHPDVLTYIGFTYRKLGDYATAQRYYEQALTVAPNHKGATEYYGELKVERGDIAGAKQMLAKLESICRFGCAEAEELRRWIDGVH